MAIAITPDQQALQASFRDWAKQAAPLAAVRRIAMSTLASERVAIGTGQDEAVQTLLAAGGAEHPFFSERTGVHVATSLSIALLGERCPSRAAPPRSCSTRWASASWGLPR